MVNNMYLDLKGQTALVTGAGKKTGIGYAIAEKLAQSGANVVLADFIPGEEEKNSLLVSGDRQKNDHPC
jgi:NAD(P)-dependent dehydrogenase (short-subunit alcohol dehydrogenase family)